MKKYYCKKCGKLITKSSKSGLCKSCVNKGKNNPRFGKKVLKVTKQKMSIAQIKRFQDSKEREKTSKATKKFMQNPEIRLKISKAGKGRIVSEITRQKLSEKTTKQWSNINIKNKISGKNHYAYIDGTASLPYTKEFTSTLKKFIIERDNYKCQCCGMSQEEHKKKYSNRSLEVHHIDHCPDNCKKTNLITVCKQCNINANYERDYYYSLFNYIMEEK
jgi:hypothetical protein